ncbi:MAG: hypothetical protein HY014_08395 [Acidobacteria bacterium]|nr:hypothetical protein [Acidobacteriota bacterium]MBI3488171.1 hypothetical protein [Acidobacteriota bacterium]
MLPLLSTAYLMQTQQLPSGLSKKEWSSRAEIEMQAEDWQALNLTSQRFTKDFPLSGKAWGYLAISLLALNRPFEAELALETGTKAKPSFPGNWYNLGLVHSQLHRPPRASNDAWTNWLAETRNLHWSCREINGFRRQFLFRMINFSIWRD